MSQLPHLKEIFDKLRQGAYVTHEHGVLYSALTERPEEYAAYFAPLGLNLVRHQRDFFYLHTDAAENTPTTATLPKIAIFSFILIEAAANEGRSIEEYLLTERFHFSKLPHLTLDRYKAHLKLFEVEDENSLRKVVQSMERYGWVELFPDDTFRFLRPFHRVFDRCLEISLETESDASVMIKVPEALELETE